MTEETQRGSLWGDRDFVLFATGQGVSAIGDALSQTVLPLLVLFLTGSGTQMGIVAMLQALPSLVLGLPAGALADRWDRRRTMVVCDFARTALVATIPLSILLEWDTMTLLYAVAFPIGVLYVFFEAACLACVPALVGRERLGVANSYLSVFNSVGYVAGPGIAGVLSATIGPGLTLGLDAVTFGVSALTLAFIRRPLQVAREVDSTSLVQGMKDGLRFIARQGVLRVVLSYWVVVSLVTAPVIIVVTFFVSKDLGLSAEVLGFIVTAYAVGAIVGAVGASQLTALSSPAVMLGGMMLSGAAMIALAMRGMDGLVVSLALACVAGAGESAASIFYVTLRAGVTPDALLGRVGSTARAITLGLQPVAMFTAGVLLDAVGGATTLSIMGGLTIAASLLFALSATLRSATPTLEPEMTEVL